MMIVQKDTPLGFSMPVLPVGGTLRYEPAILRAGERVVGRIIPFDGREIVRWGPISITVPSGTLVEEEMA